MVPARIARRQMIESGMLNVRLAVSGSTRIDIVRHDEKFV